LIKHNEKKNKKQRGLLTETNDEKFYSGWVDDLEKQITERKENGNS